MLQKIALGILLFFSQNIMAQNFTGKWQGNLEVPGVTLKINFNISEKDGGYVATMDSPDQGAFGIPFTETKVSGSDLYMEISAAKIAYDGQMIGDSIVGTFQQNGMQFPMNLHRVQSDQPQYNRPQTPKPPFPYLIEEVTFPNKQAGINLAGTFTIPNAGGKFPTVVLITGSGPQNRDEEIMGHKMFWVLADYLTRNGIAVLRVDDRGVGKSGGSFASATSKDFETDVVSALEYLKNRKEVDLKNLGLIGHSEGAMIAPMVAQDFKGLNFLVLYSAPAINGKELILLQKKTIEQKMDIPETEIEKGQKIFGGAYNILIHSPEGMDLQDSLKQYFSKELGNQVPDEKLDALIQQLNTPWMRYMLQMNPDVDLKKLKNPILVINGENDLQVPYEQNSKALQEIVKSSGNKRFDVIHLPKLNHLLQESNTGLPQEYGTITQTISPEVLKITLDWIKKQVKK